MRVRHDPVVIHNACRIGQRCCSPNTNADDHKIHRKFRPVRQLRAGDMGIAYQTFQTNALADGHPMRGMKVAEKI